MNKYIAPYILRIEYSCQHCGKLPPGLKLEDPSFLFTILFDRFKAMREKWGGPLNISSGYRCPEHQLNLFIRHKSRTPYSVHIFGLALDIDMANEGDVDGLVDIIECVDSDIRIGYRDYLDAGQTFVHMDVGYLINPIYDIKLYEGARW